MTIDLDAVPAAFAASTDFTVGLEEEFHLLDPGTLDLVPRFEELELLLEADGEVGRGLECFARAGEVEGHGPGRGSDGYVR